MQSKVPLPTDNIYKFYALFGLALSLALVYAFVNMHQSFNERAYKRYIDLEVLNSYEKLTPVQKATKAILENQKKIDASDKKTLIYAIGGTLGISILLIISGFYQWSSKIQPQQDKIIEMQIKKMALEIKALNKQTSHVSFRRQAR